GCAGRARGHGVVGRRAALLAHAHVDGHLAALEAGAHLVRARARLLSLEAPAGVASLARAEAPAHPLAILTWGSRLQRGEIEPVSHALRPPCRRRHGRGGGRASAYRRAVATPRGWQHGRSSR